MSLPLILRHDEVTTNAPASSQMSVGELIINSVTGKIYTKLTNGNVVEFIGQQVCFSKLPSITYDSIDKFCCAGDIIKIKAVDLLQEKEYSFEMEDVSSNGVDVDIKSPIYTDYTTTTANGASIALREAIIPCSVTINGNKNITILKFKIILENKEITSRIITLSCQNC